MLWLIRKLLKKRKPKPVGNTEPNTAPAPVARKTRPEWETTLLGSFEQNNVAPTDEVILQSFDEFQNDLYRQITELRRVVANGYAEIVALVAALRAIIPGPFERGEARHPSELSLIVDQKEDY